MFWEKTDEDEKYFKSLKEVSSKYKEIDNPYEIFGYSLICEELPLKEVIENLNKPRIINGVEFLLSDKACYIKCKRRSLVTFVDIMFILLDSEVFSNGKYLPLDKAHLLKYYSEKLDENYFFEFKSKNSIFPDLSPLLFYIITGDYEDGYYKEMMLKTNKNSV